MKQGASISYKYCLQTYKSIIDAKKAKRLDLDYERCQGFGDIVSNFYVIFNYIFWNFASWLQLMNSNSAAAITVVPVLETGLFIVIAVINAIISIVFLSKCIKGLSKSDRMQKDTIKE